MSKTRHAFATPLALLAANALLTSGAAAQFVRIGEVPCQAPPAFHCPDGTCDGAQRPEGGSMLGAEGPLVEEGSGLHYFVDYPCDLRPGEDVTVVLSLHGAGAPGNWHRHYFPLIDYVEKHRFVVATPYSPERRWSEDYDDYLHAVTNIVVDAIGEENVRSFWLAGHSQGGITSRRIVCSPFFRDRVDGVLSLSGGRIGGQAPVSLNRPGSPPRAASGAPRPAAPDPDCDFSHIYTTGEHEMVDGLASLPATSSLAERFSCGDRVRRPDVIDTEGGYTGSNAPDATMSWGRAAGPGTANVWVYPDCDGGRVVADFVRVDKGHIEGLEPVVTEEILRLMLSAPGGKISGLR